MSEPRLIDANEIVEVAERPWNAWNLAMATQDTNQGINKVLKRQELCKAVKAVAEGAPTIDPETLPIVRKLRDQIEDVSDIINAYHLIGKSMYFPKIKAIGMVDEVIANSDGISLFVNSGGGSFYVDFNDVRDLIKEREENEIG